MPDLRIAVRSGMFSLGILAAYLTISPLFPILGLPISWRAITLMDWQRLFELLSVACVIGLLAPWAGWRVNLERKITMGAALGWGALFLLGAISCLLSELPLLAWLEWSWLASWFLATVLLTQALPKDLPRFEQVVSSAIMLILASYTVFFYSSNYDAIFDPDPIYQLDFSGFNNVRVFTDYQTVIICFLPWAIERSLSGSRWRYAAWLLAALYTALAFVSGSRSLLLGQGVLWLACLGLLRSGSRDFLFGQLKLWILGALAYGAVFYCLPYFIFAREPEVLGFFRGTSSGRDALWLHAWELVQRYPFFGIGPSHYAVILNPLAASMHNQVIQLAAEWGVPAALLFVALMGRWLWRRFQSLAFQVRECPAAKSKLAIAVMAALVVLLAQSCVSPVFNNPASQISLSVLFALSTCLLPAPMRAGKVVSQPLLAAAAIVSLVFFIVLVMPWGTRIAARNQCYSDSVNVPTKYWAPRFWQQGWVYPPCDAWLLSDRAVSIH